ncbi:MULTISPECIES: TSUP family transporter [Burkholderia]|uniref:Probable membrane transporter protein n=1 Tax=Burkholderia savannae TaxID=1637837 RepID=A0ABR5TGD2_9BURK|nr:MULTISPECIES: TSUP family transporter [Burkholderia]AOJ69892.1 hypothetical protein WS78_14810 [Burkholderia savannae]AOJ81869.1 hypothetical protein WS86_15470 [Burkholderia savannae]AOK48016.1 hypothetical protein WT60_15025 [Burkholderia sp. MSMB617WGS]KGS00723.1 sulfite exporter TauE/SafE family protein [Burkholderia sp. ABCPW 111]KVG41271.1 hypothetical protein WS77_00645 [Burkholderia sp. MSMB0265]
MHDLTLLAALVTALALIQSIFGMGILVFGTPTLLLFGVEFAAVLGLLLPASMTLSAIQVWSSRGLPLPARERGNMAVCAAVVVVSLATLVLTKLNARVDLFVGGAMLAAAVVRVAPVLRDRLRARIARHDRRYVVLMGVVHGLTNMGGALLAVYAASGQRDKDEIRAIVARYYLLFGTIQLGTLALLRPAALSWSGAAVAPIAALVYVALGNAMFRRAGASLYEHAMTGFIGAYGAAVLAKTAL